MAQNAFLVKKQWIKNISASTRISTPTNIYQILVRLTRDQVEGSYLQKLTLSIKSQSPDFRARTNMLSTHSNVPWLRPLDDCISFTPKLRNSSTSLANSEMSQAQHLISNQDNRNKQQNKTKKTKTPKNLLKESWKLLAQYFKAS